MPAGDVFGLDGIFLNKSNPITVSAVEINQTTSGAGIAVTAGTFSAGTVTLIFDTAVGLSTTPFYTGAKIAVSGLADATGLAHTAYNGNFVVTGFAGTTTVSYATTGYVGAVSPDITTTGLVMLATDTAVTNTTWSSDNTHGWFVGRGFPGTVSNVDRIDFSNDTGTANVRGPLSTDRGLLASVGNSNYGWFGGGFFPGPAKVSTVDRIDFSNDSGSTSVRGSLSAAKYIGPSATGNSNYGWFGGGGLPAKVSTVDRIDFSNDSGTASVRGPLTSSKYNIGATGNSNYGWFGGGTPGPLSTVDRIDFSNDSATASPRSPLNSARYGVAATGNSNYGWFGGGTTGLDPSNVSTIQRIDFSNDLVVTSIRGPLSGAKWASAATGNSNYGWFGGGLTAPGTVSTVDRIDFSNDSATASPRGPLSYSTSKFGATSGQANRSAIKLQKAGNYGWFGGGIITILPGTLTPVSAVDRIDFSNDSVTAPLRGPLSSARGYTSSTGNSNYGWYGGGSGFVSTVDRIDFSNDSVTASVRGSLSGGRAVGAATGNSNYGWFGGGNPAATNSRVDRINFSNDSSTASVRGPLSAGRYALGAVGNYNYGWFGGGRIPSPLAATAIVDRINFSNDSVSASPRGQLSQARYYIMAAGNSNYGWFAGGFTSVQVGTVDRMDFSNDLSTATPRAPLSITRHAGGATGNSNYSWFAGSGPAGDSRVDRINFSNDSATPSPRGPITTSKGYFGASSNTTR